MFFASVGYNGWGCLLEKHSGTKYKLDFSTRFDEHLKPLKDIIEEFALPLQAEVFSLSLKSVKIVWPNVFVKLCDPMDVDMPEARPRRRKGADDGDCNQSGDEMDAPPQENSEDHWLDAEAHGLPSDVSSVVSDMESDVEDEAEEQAAKDVAEDPLDSLGPVAEESDDDADDADGSTAVGKKKAGTHTVAEHSNVYFTMTNNFGYLDVMLGMLPRWQKDTEMGTPWSKRVRPQHYAETKENPRRSYTVLRAWMLWRTQQSGWKDRKVVRQRWWAGEEERLRTDIENLQVDGGGTGSEKADRMIRDWAPSVL